MAVIATFLKCVEETDELGSDDVYSIAWSAGVPNIVWTTLTTSTDPSLGTSDWSDFDEGELRTKHRLVYPTIAITGEDVQIAVLEKDWGHDFHATATATKELENFLQAKLAVTPPSVQAVLMPAWFVYGIAKFGTNDEVIGFTSVGQSSDTETKDITLTGAGGKYRLKLKSKL